MKLKFIYLILIYFTVFFISCRTFSEHPIYKNMNARNLSDSFPLLNKYVSFDYAVKYIMVHYFNGNCSQCIGALNRRKRYVDSLFNKKIELLFIADAQDTAALNYFLIDLMNFNKIVL